MRRVETCPYRQPAETGGLAICRHLIETTGIRDHALAEVSKEVCAHCCTQFEPLPRVPNPTVASRLFHLTQHIIAHDGLPGCSLEEAQALKKLAISHLTVEGREAEQAQQSRIARHGPCFYLGEQTGTRRCQDCQGHVELKTFACNHELHDDEVIWRECQRCPDYDRRLGKQQVRHWMVGVTTAPRREFTLEASLESLAQAGWHQALVFAEPHTPSVSSLPETQWIQRQATLGAWPNFLLALNELILRSPHADAYLMCQDDVIYTRGLRDYLEEELWPADQVGVVSLHTASHQDRGDIEGFFPADLGWDAWGAQAYVFPNAAARAFVRHPRVVNHRHRGPRDGKCNVDSVVGQWCQTSGFPYYLHTPSLTQHVGDTSTLWRTARTQGRRRAATFRQSL